jgi:hypothetical protein
MIKLLRVASHNLCMLLTKLSMIEKSDPYELLTIEEILIEYREIARPMRWDARKLADVMRTGGLVGEWDNSIKRYVFIRWSIIAYIKHINKLHDAQKYDFGDTR